MRQGRLLSGTPRWTADPLKIYDVDNRELMTVTAIERDGSELVIRGKIFGSMPLVAKLTPSEARAALKLLNFRTAWWLLTLLLRR